MNINCPHCGTAYEVEKKDLYRFVNCEVCGKGFVLGATTNLTVPNWVEQSTKDSRRDAYQRLAAKQQARKGFFFVLIFPWLNQWRSIFTFEGCVDRTSYFKFAGLNILLYLLAYNFLVGLMIKIGCNNTNVESFIYGLVQSAIVLSFVPVTIKRLRDAKRSVHWTWLMFAIGLITRLNLYVTLVEVVVIGVLRPNGGTVQSGFNVSSKWLKIAFMIGVLGYASLFTWQIHNMMTNVHRQIDAILRDAPFRNITCSRIQGDGMSSVYMFTTDAPACAKCMAVYVMGSLYSIQTVDSANSEKAAQVEKYIRENYELEGFLSR